MGGGIRKIVLGERIVPAWGLAIVLVFGLFPAAVPVAVGGDASEAAQGVSPERSVIVARVDGAAITRQAFIDQYRSAVRQKFYHRRPPEAEMAAFRRDLLDGLIERELLRSEVGRRGIEADDDAVRLRMTRVTARYEGSDLWEREGERLSLELHEMLALDSRIARLRGVIETQIPAPDVSQLKDYYQVNIRKFTTPPRLRVSLILIKVAPWERSAVWQAAKDQTESFRRLISRGMDFAVVAKERSDDDSAQRGGDLGYLHRGMLSPEAGAVIDKLKAGEVSASVRLLRGYALFRLDERQVERVNAFESVAQRVRDMWRNDARERVWTDFVAGLRSAARIEIDKSGLNGATL